jgi:hypothetical protein
LARPDLEAEARRDLTRGLGGRDNERPPAAAEQGAGGLRVPCHCCASSLGVAGLSLAMASRRVVEARQGAWSTRLRQRHHAAPPEREPLNQIVRQHMEQITGRPSRDAAAREFEPLARTGAGRFPKGYRFDRDAVHGREG